MRKRFSFTLLLLLVQLCLLGSRVAAKSVPLEWEDDGSELESPELDSELQLEAEAAESRVKREAMRNPLR